MSKTIILTFDIEEWFHTTYMSDYIPLNLLEESRVEYNLEFPLELLDKFEIPATFFVLGELAAQNPRIVHKILAVSPLHEIASHSYYHDLLFEMREDKIKRNIIESKKLLEDISGNEIQGFRAPYFSINDYALEQLSKAGYKYDSSLHDFRLNKQYGHLTLDMQATPSPGIFTYQGLHEVTIPVKRYLKFLRLPFGGGGYFRLYPLALQFYWINSFLKNSDYFIMYLHPWEFDKDHPYVRDVPFLSRQRHYYGIKNHYRKTEKLISKLQAAGYAFSTLSKYLKDTHRS